MKLKYRVIERFREKYSVEAMGEVFKVSRSGYYAWRKRQERVSKDQWLADLIVECQKKCRQTYGIRRVRRWIRRQTGKNVNLKAILRLMRKLNLLSVVRRRRFYTRYQQAVHKYPNLLNRCFDQVKPNQFWVTDITCIPIPGSMLYMCAVLDLCGKVVLNWKISSEMSSSLVADALRDALQQKGSLMASPFTVTSSIYYQSIPQPETSISRFAVDVQSLMPLRQRGDGKFLRYLEDEMPIPRQLLPAPTRNNSLPSTSISTILSISCSKRSYPI